VVTRLELGDDGPVVDVGRVVDGEPGGGEGGDGAPSVGEDEPSARELLKGERKYPLEQVMVRTRGWAG
jgi:hypothetical protein